MTHVTAQGTRGSAERANLQANRLAVTHPRPRGSGVTADGTNYMKKDATGVRVQVKDGSSVIGTPVVGTIPAVLTHVNTALASRASGAKKVSVQTGFAQKPADTLTAGIGNRVDADRAKESAKLQSLQVKQQLGVQALSIANQAPQTILSLFR